MSEYRTGYSQCMSEVSRTLPGSEYIVREKLLTQLASSFHSNSVAVPASSPTTTTPNFPAIPATAMWIPYPSPPPSPTKETPIFLPSCMPVQTEFTRPPTPVSPCSIPQNVTAQASPVANKPLWRPW